MSGAPLSSLDPVLAGKIEEVLEKLGAPDQRVVELIDADAELRRLAGLLGFDFRRQKRRIIRFRFGPLRWFRMTFVRTHCCDWRGR